MNLQVATEELHTTGRTSTTAQRDNKRNVTLIQSTMLADFKNTNSRSVMWGLC